MEPEGSLLHSQVPATRPSLEPDRLSPCHHNPLPEDPSYYYAPIYARVPQLVSFPQFSPPKPYMPRISHSFRENRCSL